MRRREFIKWTGAAVAVPAVGIVGCRSGAGQAAFGADDYERVVVIDALGSPLQFNIPQGALPLSDAVLTDVRQSGITAINVTMNVRPSDDADPFTGTRERVTAWTRETEAHPGVLSLARSVSDIRAAKTDGRLAIIVGFQDTTPFGEDTSRIDDFYDRGLRVVQLTYNGVNAVGSGCLAQRDGGLTEFGRSVVARLDDLGILVDLSHCGTRTTLEGVRASERPVSITHSGCNTVFRHPRNKNDDALRLMADRGGVVGIYLMPFLNRNGPPSPAHVIQHLEHALNVCGEDHVGIGTDQGITPLDVDGDFQERFDQVSAQRQAAGVAAPREDTIPYVPALNHPRRLATLADMLAQRGHSPRVVEKVLGANWLRLFDEVWAKPDVGDETPV